jgi:uncharacterized Zn finger protein (UPF0148 family)
MDIRGERECQSCGTRWSYYDTGEISCPNCGSIHSVGVDERTTHTAGAAELELTDVIADVDEVPVRELAERADERASEYVRAVGFIHAGDLQPLSETYLTACELRHVAATVSQVMYLETEEELYFLDLLRGAATGDRPDPEDVPESLRAERALAAAAAVDAYLSELRRYREDREESVDRVLSAVTARRKRVEALDGEVEPAEAERLVGATQDLSAYLREGDETALARALDRL